MRRREMKYRDIIKTGGENCRGKEQVLVVQQQQLGYVVQATAAAT